VVDIISYSDKWVAALTVFCALIYTSFTFSIQKFQTKKSENLNLGFLYIVVLFSITLPIFGYWIGGRSHTNAIGGLLPWNDAAGYFNCARALVDGSALDPFCQRRPHYSGYLSGLFTLTGERLQLTLLLQAMVVAIASILFIGPLSKRWGLGAALMGLSPIVAFAGEYSITTLTENLGLPLGLVAVTFLLSGAQSQRTGILAFGAFLLAIAINARAGAFLVLLLLLLWPLMLSKLSWVTRFLLAAIMLTSIAAGFLVGPALSSLLGGNPGATHANFSYTIYGIAAGGKGWLHIYSTHPDLVAKLVPEAQRASNVYSATWKLFLDRPDLTLQGLGKGFLIYLERILKYIPWLPVRIVVVLCWIVGISNLVRHRHTPEASMLGLMALGIALSAPILAFDVGLRIYAATIAVDAAIVAVGAAVLINLVPRQLAKPNNTFTAWSPAAGSSLWGMAAALLITVLVLPIALRSTAQPIRYYPEQENICVAGEQAVTARLGRSSPILPVVTVNNSSAWPARPPAHQFVNRIDRGTFGSIGFEKTEPGMTYIAAYNLSHGHFGQTSILMAQSIDVPSDGQRYILCTKEWPDSPLDGVRRITSVNSAN
jgi:hypothetical protein